MGDNACSSCHREKAGLSPHRSPSDLAGRQTRIQSWENSATAKIFLKTSNPELFYRMDANPGGQFQTAVMGIPPDTTSRTERFDLVIGSGGKGQLSVLERRRTVSASRDVLD